MVDVRAETIISDIDTKTMQRRTVNILQGLFSITIPNGTMYDVSVDKHTGNLTISSVGGGQVVVIPHVANTISVRVE